MSHSDPPVQPCNGAAPRMRKVASETAIALWSAVKSIGHGRSRLGSARYHFVLATGIGSSGLVTIVTSAPSPRKAPLKSRMTICRVT